MRYLLAIVLLSAAVHAQSFTSTNDPALPDAPSQKPFWTTGNKVDVSILAGLVTADAITTQRGLNQGLREANPLMRPFVTNSAVGEAVGSALGFGAALGAVYLLHQTHHYNVERVVMRFMVAAEGGVVANNIIAIR
jgi:hypothetical protein